MARFARSESVNPAEVQVIHCVQRCVRRAFLCGRDDYLGKSFEHRREWIRERMEWLASSFGIDVLTYAVMHNHVHVVLRSRPDVVQAWSDREVARRWLRLFPFRREADGMPSEPSSRDIESVVRDKKGLSERRLRLSDVSWWMRCLAEVIARRANREDECKGRFWEGRFKAQVLLDEAGLLACAAYVDLNPIRAAMAKTLEESTLTGLHERLEDLKGRRDMTRGGTHAWERSDRRRQSGWLSPVEIAEGEDGLGADPCSSGRRASQKGFLAMSLADYVAFVEWTGRQLRSDKRGNIPAEVSSILSRLGLDEDTWCGLVRTYGKTYYRVAGTVEHVAAEAQRRGLQWMHAPGNPLGALA